MQADPVGAGERSKGRSIDVGVTFLAVLDGEGDGKMAGAAKLAAVDVVHAKVLGSLFLDVEYIRMAVGAVEPLGVFLMRENRYCPDAGPFGLQLQGPAERDGLKSLFVKTQLRVDQSFFERQ